MLSKNYLTSICLKEKKQINNLNRSTNPGLQEEIRRKDKLLKKFIRTKKQIRKQLIHNEYKILRNQILDLRKKSKQNFYQQF